MAESPVGESICLHLPLPTPVTDEELIGINDRNPGWKIERGANGELEARMVAGGSSSEITAELTAELVLWRRNMGGGRVRESDGTFNLRNDAGDERTWAPDVSWISPEQIAAIPPEDRPKTGFWTLCPEFVIEVRSPSDALNQQQRRMQRWLTFGVQLGWLIDPLRQTVWIYRPGVDAHMLSRPSTLSGESVLNGLTVELSYVWELAVENQSQSLAEGES